MCCGVWDTLMYIQIYFNYTFMNVRASLREHMQLFARSEPAFWLFCAIHYSTVCCCVCSASLRLTLFCFSLSAACSCTHTLVVVVAVVACGCCATVATYIFDALPVSLLISAPSSSSVCVSVRQTVMNSNEVNMILFIALIWCVDFKWKFHKQCELEFFVDTSRKQIFVCQRTLPRISYLLYLSCHHC